MKDYVPRRLRVLAVAIPAGALAIFSALPTSAGLAHGAYQQTNLVSNDTTRIPAIHEDKHLVNPWGISGGPATSPTPFWVSDNGKGVTTLYRNGMPLSLVVTIPPPAGGTTSAPTGTVFNGTSDFKLSDSNPARFVFATEDGTIAAWNPADSTKAELPVDNS